jgi:hypothetical protein
MKISYPFSSRLNPLVREVNSIILEWGQQVGILPDKATANTFDKMKINWFAAYLYPDADREWLTLISKLFSSLFLIDDRMESMEVGKAMEWAEYFGSSTGLILKEKTIAPNADPFVHAFFDFVKSLEMICSPEGFKEFRRDWSDFCEAMTWEASNRLKGIIPEVMEYSIYRLYFSGAFLAIFFAKELSPAPTNNLFNTCRIEFFNYLAASLICLSNDLGSYQKEIRSGENHNRVIILMKKLNLSENKAVSLTLNTHDRMLKEFLSGQNTAKNEDDHLFSGYFDALKHLIAGSNTWSELETQRYYNQKNGSVNHK